MVDVSKGPGVLGKYAKIVEFLKNEGFNSTQIRYICIKILKITNKIIYNKIILYSKNIEINDCVRKFKNNNVLEKMKLQKLI